MARETLAGELPVVEPSRARQRSRFPCFDGLRAIAAVAVVAAHATGYLYYRYHQGRRFAPLPLQEWLARLGGFGVAVFFVISGFLLFRPFVLSHFRSEPSPHVGPFWFRRFIRIFPAYWLVITVAIFVLGTLEPQNLGDYFTFYSLALNYRAGYATFGIGVEWTLVIELSFYLVLPGIAWGLRALTRPDASARTKYRAQIAGLLGLGVAAIALRAWELWVFQPATSPVGTWFAPSELETWLISYLDWFVAGMVLAVVSAWLAVGGRLPRFLAVLARRSWLSWILAIECYWIVTRLKYPMYGYFKPRPIQEFLRLEMCLAAAVFLVLPAVFGNQEHGAIRGALRSRPLVWLGLISYGIYLWHVPIFSVSEGWGGGLWPSNPMVQVLLIFGLTLLAATFSYLVVERPTRRWAHRLTRPKLAPATVPQGAASPSTTFVHLPVPATEPPADDVLSPEDEVLPLVIYGAVAILIGVVAIVLPSVPPIGG